MEAILNPTLAPLFCQIINSIKEALQSFMEWRLASIPPSSNRAATEIALTVTKDHWYQSYIARDGPFWLSDLLSESSRATC